MSLGANFITFDQDRRSEGQKKYPFFKAVVACIWIFGYQISLKAYPSCVCKLLTGPFEHLPTELVDIPLADNP